MKCAGSHRSFECELRPEEKASCCNCGGAHPASSVECPEYVRALESRRLSAAKRGVVKDSGKAVRYVDAPLPRVSAWERTERRGVHVPGTSVDDFPPLSAQGAPIASKRPSDGGVADSLSAMEGVSAF